MTVLIGSNDTTGGTDDGFSAGDMVATAYVAAASGSVATLKVVIRSSAFTSLKLAIYADGGAGDPGAKLGEATITDTTAGIKSIALSPSVAVVSGTTYWLGLLPLGSYCDITRTATGGYDVQTGKSAFPDPWGTSASDTSSGGLAIQGESASGTDATVTAAPAAGAGDVPAPGLPTSAPVNTVAPAVTGTPTEGDTLTTTNGMWSPDGTKTYQWQRLAP